MKPKLSAKLTRLLARYRYACETLSWKGSCDPDDWEAIEETYKKTRDRLLAYLAELEGKSNEPRPATAGLP